jgi:hypothetical protein
MKYLTVNLFFFDGWTIFKDTFLLSKIKQQNTSIYIREHIFQLKQTYSHTNRNSNSQKQLETL